MINNEIIDEAFEFYQIDSKYKKECYRCAQEINNNDSLMKAFTEVYHQLYYGDFNKVKKLWKKENVNRLFIDHVNPLVTNLMVLLGYEMHARHMKERNFDDTQVQIHKKRIKDCFENDLIHRGYKGIRISQMLWATYFIRTRIIEVGRFQYEVVTNEEETFVKIHIPRNGKLDIFDVKKSINDSKMQLEKFFHISHFRYLCYSWLLSNQIYPLMDENTNIHQFHDLFRVEDGEDCTKDILNFVYEIDSCDDFSLLPENTSLQRILKEQLLSGKIFYLGLGELRSEENGSV